MGGISIQTLHGVRYTIKSEEARAGDVVVIDAQQMALFGPPRVESAMHASVYAGFTNRAEVRKTPAGWRVVSFEPTFQKMDEMPKPQQRGYAWPGCPSRPPHLRHSEFLAPP